METNGGIIHYQLYRMIGLPWIIWIAIIIVLSEMRPMPKGAQGIITITASWYVSPTWDAQQRDILETALLPKKLVIFYRTVKPFIEINLM